MHKPMRLILTLSLAGLLLNGLSSCSSSRMAGGFSYRGSQHAPNVGSSGESVLTRPASPSTAPAPAQLDELEKAVTMVPADHQEQAKVVAQAIREEMAVKAAAGERVTHREMLHSVTQKLVNSGQIQPISEQNMRKMDKMARKMDQKAQKGGPDLDMRNISGLEWFFLIMSGAGLVLGIIGVALGWVVFLVFGGLFLYWKLVKDN